MVDLLAIRPPPEAQIAKLEHSAAPRPGLAGFARVLAEAAYGSLEEQRRLRRAVSLEVAKFADGVRGYSYRMVAGYLSGKER